MPHALKAAASDALLEWMQYAANEIRATNTHNSTRDRVAVQ